MRVEDEVALGNAKVSLTLEGWPIGRVLASTHAIPVVRRKPLPEIAVSKEQQRVLPFDGYSIYELRFTPDGKQMLIVLTKSLKDGRLYQYRLWDALTGKELRKVFQIEPQPLDINYSPYLFLSPHSKRAAIRYNVVRYTKEGKDYRRENLYKIHVLDLDAGSELWRKEVLGKGIGDFDWSPDGQTLAAGEYTVKETGEGKDRKRDFRGELSLWDAKTGKLRETLAGGPYQILWSTKFSRDGKYLLFTDEHRIKDSEYRVGVWDLAAQKTTLQIKGLTGSTKGVFSPNSKRLVTCGNVWIPGTTDYNRDVRIWDLDLSNEVAALPLDRGKGWIYAHWSAEGRFVFVTSSQGDLWRWDPSGAKRLVKVETIKSGSTIDKYERNAREQAFHPGRQLFAFGVNGKLPRRQTQRTLPEDFAELPPPEIVIWDLETMEQRARLTGHHGQINHLMFSHDGQTLISGGSDGTVRQWKVPNRPGPDR